MSCRCDRPGWIEGHDAGCAYEGGATPWFDIAIDRLHQELSDLRKENEGLRVENEGLKLAVELKDKKISLLEALAAPKRSLPW